MDEDTKSVGTISKDGVAGRQRRCLVTSRRAITAVRAMMTPRIVNGQSALALPPETAVVVPRSGCLLFVVPICRGPDFGGVTTPF